MIYRHARFLLPVRIFLLVVAAVAAQVPTRTPEFRLASEVASLEVIVTDGRGRSVSNLTRDDFEIVESGTPVPLSAFSKVEAGPLLNGEKSVIQSNRRSPLRREQVRRTIAFVVDDFTVAAPIPTQVPLDPKKTNTLSDGGLRLEPPPDGMSSNELALRKVRRTLLARIIHHRL